MFRSPTRKQFFVTLQASVADARGKVTAFPERPANSLLTAFVNLLFIQLAQLTTSIRDTSNTLRNVALNTKNLMVAGGAANTTTGILIGSGTTAPTMADYKIETQLTANVTHGATSLFLDAPDANTYVAAIARTFTNLTGGILAIREVALVVEASSAPAYYFCIDRTLFSEDVPNGLPTTLTYRIYVTL